MWRPHFGSIQNPFPQGIRYVNNPHFRGFESINSTCFRFCFSTRAVVEDPRPGVDVGSSPTTLQTTICISTCKTHNVACTYTYHDYHHCYHNCSYVLAFSTVVLAVIVIIVLIIQAETTAKTSC